MNTTRRGLFQFAGGAAVGALLTPAPWRLITDAALWSENWPGIPRPARGEVAFRYGHCSLCTAGCAVRARTVAGQPVSLTGIANHPLDHGALCPFGIAAHHLPNHPERLKRGPVEKATAAVKSALGALRQGERCAVLDLRPGRTASWTYRRAMAALEGLYLAPVPPLGESVAVNLAAAKTVLSLGVPLFDGWGTPGNVIAAREHFRLIHADAVESRTAMMSDVWLPIRPGSERELADAIGRVLRGGDAPSSGVAATGVSAAQIADVARELRENGPSLVLDHSELNLLLGAPGRTLVERREAPVPEAWKKAAPVSDAATIADGSIRVLLIDEAGAGDVVAWAGLQPKLAADAVIVTFACTEQPGGQPNRYALPTPVFPETLDDIPPAIDSPAAVFRLSAALVAPPKGVVEPAAFVAELAGLDAKNALKERAEAICRSGRGLVLSPVAGASKSVRGVAREDFWGLLEAGAVWIDDMDPHAAAPKLAASTPARPLPAGTLPLVVAMSESCRPPLVSPILSKIYQESNLRLAPGHAALNPADAHAAGIHAGDAAYVKTAAGAIRVEVEIDPDLPPGVVEVPGEPRTRSMCRAASSAKVVRS